MGADPPSPSPSTTLIPFLSARSRRGSLASITSRSGVDKNVLAQALDEIHTSASKSEALTSFHDFDGGGGRPGAKELVSNGVSGLYNKLRQSVGGSPGGKSGKGRSNADSKESLVGRESAKSPTALRIRVDSSRTSRTEITSASNSPSSPAIPRSATIDGGNARDGKDAAMRPDMNGGKPPPSPKPEIERQVKATSNGTTFHAARNISTDDPPKTRGDWTDDGSNKSTTHARATTDDSVPGGDAKQILGVHTAADLEDEEAIDDSDYAENPNEAFPAVQAVPSHSARGSVDTDTNSSRQPLPPQVSIRPPMVTIGASHLPNYAPSQSSSLPETNNTHVSTRDPSPNINAALQRKRTGVKSSPSSSQLSVPTHFKRQVLAKEFWMKDENAKGCHQCGQSFSTFRRKHHCRTCGNIFDAKCTSLVSGRPFGQPGSIRLCKTCEMINYDASDDDDDSTVWSDDGEDHNRQPFAYPLGSLRDTERLLAQTDGSTFSRTDNEIFAPFIGIPTSRRNREAKRRSAVIEFDTPALTRPVSSHSLTSLSHRPRSSSHRRRHSRLQPGRGLRSSVDERAPFHQDSATQSQGDSLLPAFHHDNVIDPDLAPFLSDEDSDDEDHRSMASAVEGVSASPGERERLAMGGFFSSALRRRRSRLGDKSTAPSSVRGVKDDDVLSRASKRTPNLLGIRDESLGSISQDHNSPRRSRSNLLDPRTKADPTSSPQSSFATPVKPSAPNIICSTALCGLNKPTIALNSASLEHVRKLLSQLLRDMKVSSAPAWERALMPIILQCAENVEPAVQQGDDMDIRHYIKLKKVPGGKPGDTSYVSGVVFSKNVALKSMARLIIRPRIAIITFALEYARHETHFMSLEPVIAQEHEYLQNLVARIAALRPHLLLVQQHVSGLALRLLEEAGITVVSNIKESVLAAVARVTGTTLIKSIDKLGINPSQLGGCDVFEVKTYAFERSRKTYIYLSGCEPDLGCTIVLRGADTKALRSIKRITEFMCYVAYNLKLEDCLMRDQFVSIPPSAKDHTEAHDYPQDGRLGVLSPPNVSLPDHDLQAESGDLPFKYERVEQETRARVLSASPFVVFMQPYILTQLRELERKLATYKLLRDRYAAADEDDEGEDGSIREYFELVKPEMVNAPPSKEQPKTVRDYLHAVHEVQLEKAMHTYETQERQWESFVSGGANPFDPFSHQKIDVLFSTVSSITFAACTTPELLGMGFYAGYSRADLDHDEDMALGQYIEDLCMSANDTCKECNKKMHDHHRQYVHGYGQLSVSLQQQPAKMRGLNNTILMWSTCRICRHETQLTKMSDLTWKYSFAKYLELSFWSSPLNPRAAGLCKHDINRDFLRCFGYQDLVVRFQYDAVDIYEIVVPRARVTWKVEADLVVKNQQYTNFSQRLEAFSDSVRKRLDSINVDTLDEKKAEEAQEKLEELRARADSDHDELLQKLQRKYASSRYYELIPLNRALRFMDEKAIAWDEAFNNFEQDYFPSETDIRQLATLQLRNMFLESQPAPSSVASDSDTEEGTEKNTEAPNSASRQLNAEKAHDVLSSVVEDHKASAEEIELPNSAASKGTDSNTDPKLCHKLSPDEQEHLLEQNGVKHLDLAVSPRSNGAEFAGKESSSPEETATSSRPSTRDTHEPDQPFATQPKPLSSGLLERIEQIRNNRTGGPAEQEVLETKIPRLADLKRSEASPNSPPPLLRAQSQPSHVPKRSTDSKSDSGQAPVLPTQPNGDLPPPEKRLSERLGVSRLVNKVGKVAPSLIPRSIPSKSYDQHVSSVSALAKHFEQMSREFEKERLRERRQRALRSRQARANPLASSRPVVEVYQNATEAVGERLSQDQDGKDEEQSQGLRDEITSENHTQNEAWAVVDQANSLNDDTSAQRNLETGELLTGADGSREAPDPASDHSSSVTSPVAVPDIAEINPELSIPEHRKNIWFKYLAEFWSNRSASGWANLEYPLHINEHVFEDSDIIVREDEPSSVIALSLASADYRNKVKEFRSQPNKQPSSKHSHTFQQTGIKDQTFEGEQTDIEASLLSDTGTHMKYSFAHGPVKASCKIFYAESFDALRRRCGVADRFIESMSRCLKFDSKGGKTKSLFLRSLDGRFIIKSLQEVELKAFTKFAPDYFNFMSYTLFHGVPSVIAKMFGLFQVNVKNPATGVDFSYFLLVMENLFYERNPTRRFDLKGSMRNRKIESTGQEDEVLLDENLVETIFESPLFVREHSRKLLQASVFNDTLWLCKQNVMDYSLMAGFDDPRKELVIGIIDCIRTFTFDKRLESWIKDRGKNKPTIVSPREYRNRFRVSMMQYALCAPSCWHQFTVQMGAPKTLKEREDKDETDTDPDRG